MQHKPRHLRHVKQPHWQRRRWPKSMNLAFLVDLEHRGYMVESMLFHSEGSLTTRWCVCVSFVGRKRTTRGSVLPTGIRMRQQLI
mmetsp:Transcript_14453/g.22997  ORF Transcript_14453/g.22997 Transcript_14453/m.22997 type:complete len:85 (+) Transcript_14453:288-542(+)